MMCECHRSLQALHIVQTKEFQTSYLERQTDRQHLLEELFRMNLVKLPNEKANRFMIMWDRTRKIRNLRNLSRRQEHLRCERSILRRPNWERLTNISRC